MSACSEKPLPLRVTTLRDDPNDETVVDEAVAILGHTWEPTHSAVVVTEVVLTEPDGEIGGLTFTAVNPCIKGVLAIRNPVSLAHELGHAYGLDHVCDPDDCEMHFCFGIRKCTDDDETNLMHPFAQGHGGTDLTMDQQETIDGRVRRQSRCKRSRIR